MSRLGLSGVGIACGFQMNPIFTVDQKAVKSIRISQGTGATTDGDLVQFFDLLEENLNLQCRCEQVEKLDQYQYLGNCLPTPPLTQQ